jgi:hypothetical protein
MNIGMTLIFVATIGIIGQFFIDYIIKKKKCKKIIGLVLMLCAGLGIWGSYYLQEKENKSLSKDLSDIKKSNVKLSSNLELRNADLLHIRGQNDELKLQIAELKKQQDEIKIISELATKEISRSREVINSIGTASISRGMSQIDKIKIIEILNKFNNKEVSITSVLGDTEALSFAEQLKEVFTQAGWKVDGINQAVYKKAVNGIIIKIKNKALPDHIKAIVRSLILIRMKPTAWLNPDNSEEKVDIIVGSRS